MNTQTTENTGKNNNRVKLNKEFLNIKELGAITGFILGNFEKKHSQTWESDFLTVDFKDQTGEIFKVVMDGGLRGALKTAGIIEGNVVTQDKMIESFDLKVLKADLLIEIEYEGTVETDNGNANKYAVYQIQN